MHAYTEERRKKKMYERELTPGQHYEANAK